MYLRPSWHSAIWQDHDHVERERFSCKTQNEHEHEHKGRYTANVKLKLYREINRKGRGTYLVKTTMTANVKLN